MPLAKGILIIVTSLTLLIGAAIIGVSGWLFVQDFEFKDLTGNQLIDYGLLGIGIFIFLMGFLGCCGAMFEKPFLLKTYLALVVMLLLVEIGVSIYVIFQAKQVRAFIESNWNGLNDNARISIQGKMDCCGMENLNLNHNSSSHESCFDSNGVRKKNCLQRLLDVLNENSIIVGSSLASLVLIEIIIILSCVMLLRKLATENNIKRVHPIMNGYDPYDHIRIRRLAGGVKPQPPRPTIQVEEFDVDDYDMGYPRKPVIERGGWAKNSSRHVWKHQ